MNCQWVSHDGGVRCVACGVERPTPRWRRCTAPTHSADVATPTVAQQAWSYTQAVKKWRNAGYPARPSEEIARLLVICEACPHYKADGLRKHCGLCGCSCNSSDWGLVNKLAMATEECPESRW